jgi:HTH-type transcriptional regulator, sugar sensing transcriptional regulator
VDEDELSLELHKLGLTGYEARCYVFLVKLGPSDPRKVASSASVPYPNAYEALRRLTDLGWAEMVRRRPAVYRARAPKTVLGEIETKLRETFESLDAMYKSTPAEQTELVYTLRGRDRVVSKVTEMVEGAREKIMLVAPSETFSEPELLDVIHRAAARGVRVRVITDRWEALPLGVEGRTGTIVAFDLLVDDETALIGLPDLSACGWTDSSAVAIHFMQFIELLWDASSEIGVESATRPRKKAVG